MPKYLISYLLDPLTTPEFAATLQEASEIAIEISLIDFESPIGVYTDDGELLIAIAVDGEYFIKVMSGGNDEQL